MNVARSTFVQRGYLLTALAVAVLLAGFSSAAWAQAKVTTPSRISGPTTLLEGADADDPDAARPLKVQIIRTPRSLNDPYNYPPTAASDNHLVIAFEHDDGEKGLPTGVSVKADGMPVAVNSTTGTGNLVFDESSMAPRSETTTVRTTTDDTPLTAEQRTRSVTVANREIVLEFKDERPDDGNWLPEKFSMTVGKHEDLGGDPFTDKGTTTTVADGGTSTAARRDAAWDPEVAGFTSSKFTVTIADDDPTPKFRFSSRNIQLAEENVQVVTVSVGVGAGGAIPLPGAATDAETASIRGRLMSLSTAGSHDVLLTVSPPDAVGRLINIRMSGAGTGDETIIHPDTMGRYLIGQISEAVPITMSDGIEFRIEAKEVSGFRDEQVTLMVMDGRTAERMEANGGGIDDADPATVNVVSGVETPTVTFSTDSIDIDEGESETVHLLAGGMQGDEVGSVSVEVRGEAMISLEQNGSPTSGLVSFGGNANAELTIVSNSDPSLEDGEEKTATVTITDASGALIGDPGTVTVTVVGSTAVPVLPLLGQLLLALLLMVGGARLYRRRQG